MKNFIDLRDFNKEQLEAIITSAENIKKGKVDVSNVLDKKNLGILFSVASTRTRISFQIGVRQMGGYAEYFNTNDLQLINHESLIDTAQVMGRYLDGLIVRMYDMNNYGKGREAMELLANYSQLPVINALDDKDHPCQVMGDFLTLKEKLGEEYRRKKVVFTWGYAKRQKSPGVPHSFLSASSLLGMNVTFAFPKGFELDEEYICFAKHNIKNSGGTLGFSNNLMEASEGADVIYVKSWKALNMSTEEDLKLRNEIRNDWCVSQKHFDIANRDALFMNCLPINRGEQAMAEIIDRPDSILYDEAENRLHIQKAILAYLYGKN
jgi:ornithine carbamoyltransferase